MTDKIKVTAAQLGKIIADYLGGRGSPLSASEQVAFERAYEVVETPRKVRLRCTPSTSAADARLAQMARTAAHEKKLRDQLKADEAANKVIRRIMRKFGGEN